MFFFHLFSFTTVIRNFFFIKTQTKYIFGVCAVFAQPLIDLREEKKGTLQNHKKTISIVFSCCPPLHKHQENGFCKLGATLLEQQQNKKKKKSEALFVCASASGTVHREQQNEKKNARHNCKAVKS